MNPYSTTLANSIRPKSKNGANSTSTANSPSSGNDSGNASPRSPSAVLPYATQGNVMSLAAQSNPLTRPMSSRPKLFPLNMQSAAPDDDINGIIFKI